MPLETLINAGFVDYLILLIYFVFSWESDWPPDIRCPTPSTSSCPDAACPDG